MNFLSQAGASLAAAIVLAACGGGDAMSSAHAAVLPAAGATDPAPERVSIEGCIDGTAGRSVAVRATDRAGRLLGDAPSDAAGLFRLRLPRDTDVRLAIEGDPDGAVLVRIGAWPLVIAGCLRGAA